MKPEKQQIAIAIACGWTHEYFESDSEPLEQQMWFNPDDKKEWPRTIHSVPDYLNDLNAMQKAEKCKQLMAVGITLTYIPNLVAVLRRDLKAYDLNDREMLLACIFASAKQRAEAFLKSLGLWEEES
jgi:hypothetical protein